MRMGSLLACGLLARIRASQRKSTVPAKDTASSFDVPPSNKHPGMITEQTVHTGSRNLYLTPPRLLGSDKLRCNVFFAYGLPRLLIHPTNEKCGRPVTLTSASDCSPGTSSTPLNNGHKVEKPHFASHGIRSSSRFFVSTFERVSRKGSGSEQISLHHYFLTRPLSSRHHLSDI